LIHLARQNPAKAVCRPNLHIHSLCAQGTWKALPHTYNAQKGIKRHHPQLWAASWDQVAVVHYTDAKPWHPEHPEHEHYRELVELWWRAYKGQGLGLSSL
jgi:lipopolysaccharide biosynthesis glycosyltransferase